MEKKLFTPGPLNTTASVKEAMLHDLGSRDTHFIKVVKEVRTSLLKIAGLSEEKGYEAILMQGSGTFGIESVLSSVIPANGHLLLLINGAYGERMKHIAETHKIKTSCLVYPENEAPSYADVEKMLRDEGSVSHIAMIHCETTTGILNDIGRIGLVARHYGKTFIVDAMSSFGAVPVDIEAFDIDFLISSSNKCIEGVPGFSFIIAKRSPLVQAKGNARTLSLDLYAQWEGLQNDGQFRFTPPVQAILAFHQALAELENEGGIQGRSVRYQSNHERLMKGAVKLGLIPYLKPEDQGYIISSFLYPTHANFNFQTFYEKLNQLGLVIYPGKLTQQNCFRIGNIGQLYPKDIDWLLAAIKEVLAEMNVKV